MTVNSGDVDPTSGMLTHPCFWAINETEILPELYNFKFSTLSFI